ncbi:MAG: hypothetical protein JO250_17985 [Armatimonadetes bacterium]|nr:hypothetical protein [Armatimonadota bacterium]
MPHRSRNAVVLLTAIVSLASPSLAAAQALAPATSTRTLSRYHRDDAASVTRIRINATHVGDTPLSPFTMGNFLEHLGQLVDRTLGANLLINPNLERTDPGEAMPPYWDDAGAAAWREDGGYQSPDCVRLSAPDGTLSQRLYLPVQRERRYTLTFFTRGSGQVTAAIHAGDDLQGPAVVQTPLTVAGTDWRKQTVHWTIPAGALAAGQRARFALAHAGGGPVDVDWVRLMPDDAVDGMDPDVLRLARAWDIPVLRMAGNFESQYHWRDGVGPLYGRPTQRNAAWGGPESNQFGTDEFLDLCRRIGAAPQIGANAGNGTADEAAAWVRYCNGKREQVPIWEIGNELYGGWQIGHTDAPGNAARFVAFRDAMLQADPHIKLIATGKGDETSPGGLQRDRDWNLAVLHAAAGNNGRVPDWLSIHPLVGLPGGMRDTPYAQEWQSAMAHPAFLDQTEIPQLRDQITSVEGPNARTRIAPTEWGIIIGGRGWEDGPNHNVEAGAVYNALALNTFLRNGDWVTLANATALLHGGDIAKDHGVAFVTPEYYAEQLYARAAPRLAVETDWSGPGADVPARGGLPAATDVPDVDIFSALTQDRKALVVFAVNRSLNDSKPVSVSLAGFPAGPASATILTAADPQVSNSWDHPDNVAPRPFPVPPGDSRAGWTVTLPPHALVVFTFTRR